MTVELSAPPTIEVEDDTTTGTAMILAEALADLVGVERVSVDSHFFDDLGADSMVMARFCARVRRRADVPSVSMQDIYRHPTLRTLASALVGADTAPVEPSMPTPTEAMAPADRREYAVCGALQVLVFLGCSLLAVLAIERGVVWI